MSYRLSYSEEFRRAIRTMPGNYRQRIRWLVESLAGDPRPPSARPLCDAPGAYRIRLDAWRLIYEVDDELSTVVILAIRRKSGPETYQDIGHG